MDLYLIRIKHHLNFFLINETKICTVTWRSRCCQLHSLARLNTSYRRYISWRQFWDICLIVVIFWICLRFRNVEIKYLRKMGISLKKTLLTIEPTLHCSIGNDIFFWWGEGRKGCVSALKLVYFSDFWAF